MSEFRYTPDTLSEIRAWVRGQRPTEWIARQLGCDVVTLKRICGEHGVALRPEPALPIGPVRPKYMPPAPVDPRLDPHHRRRLRAGLSPLNANVATAAIDAFAREAARRGTSAEVLAACCLELIAADELFLAILDC